jgi:hypothetical protein
VSSGVDYSTQPSTACPASTRKEQRSAPLDHPDNAAGKESSDFPIPIVAGVGGGVVVLAVVSWAVYRIHKGHGPGVQSDTDEERSGQMDQLETVVDNSSDDTVATGAGLDTYLAHDYIVSSASRTPLGNDIFGVSDDDFNDIDD